MLKVFIGVDRRQTIAYTVLNYSITSKSSAPVTVSPLFYHQMPIRRRGLTDFSYSRYCVPYLCDYQGWALFIDADFLCLADISQLFSLADDRYAVQVVKHPEHRFEWPSLMLFNCAKCTALTPEFIEKHEPQQLNWGEVGSLPKEWNYLVGYDQHSDPAKMAHYTQGIPAFLEMKGTDYYLDWHSELGAAMESCSWLELMGASVHAQHVIKRLEAQMRLEVPTLDTQAKVNQGMKQAS